MKIASLCLNTGLAWMTIRLATQVTEFRFKKETVLKGASIISRGSLIWLLSSAIFYVLTPSYFNYLESNIASVTQYWLRGHDIYTALSAPEQYSILYGPWPTIASSVFQWPGLFVIQASKLSGLFNLTLSLLFFTLLVKKLAIRSDLKPIIIGFFSLALLGFDNFSYVNRPDSFLIAYVLIGLYLVETITSENRLRHFTFIGALLGLSVASKVHSFAYFIPLAAYGFERKPEVFAIRLVAMSVLLGVVVSFTPFLLPHISFENFRVWLNVCAQHGLSLRLFTDNVTYIGVIFVPLVILKMYRGPFSYTFAALCLGAAITCVFASLVGAGTHHLIPFIPLAFFIGCATGKISPALRPVLISLFLALTYDALMSQKAVVHYFSHYQNQNEELEELREIHQELKFSQIELGYGDTEQKSMSYYKPEFLARNGTMLLEISGLMDSGFSGMSIPPQTIANLKSCSTPYFILPLGKHPWLMKSGFGLRLFSDEFVRAFFETYHLKDERRFYSVWACQ